MSLVVASLGQTLAGRCHSWTGEGPAEVTQRVAVGYASERLALRCLLEDGDPVPEAGSVAPSPGQSPPDAFDRAQAKTCIARQRQDSERGVTQQNLAGLQNRFVGRLVKAFGELDLYLTPAVGDRVRIAGAHLMAEVVEQCRSVHLHAQPAAGFQDAAPRGD